MALALPALAVSPGSMDYCGYTITITPDDPEHPGQSGTITVVSTTDAADVNLAGTYVTSDGRPPTLTVSLAGTITTVDAVYEVDRTFVFEPKTKRMVWKQIVAWIESIIAS